jgi:hypothetical protein
MTIWHVIIAVVALQLDFFILSKLSLCEKL